MAVLRYLDVELRLLANNFNNGLRAAQREANDFAKTIKPTTTVINQLGDGMKSAGKAMTAAFTVPLVALGAVSLKAASDFESSFAGVRKTVDATEAEFTKLSQGFRDLSKEIPLSVNELNRVGEAAGQLGIKKDDIIQFTKVMAQLGETTNLTADEAATATAQLQNIFGAAGKDVDRFGATLVALGNDGASTEKQIIEMGLRIAGAGHTIGLTQAQVLSFASALSSVGINAEAGGSAMSRIFLKMNDAVAGGGKALDNFAKVAGMSAAQFRTAFQKDAASATVEFIAGLGRLKEAGVNVNGVIEGLVGKNIILKDTLLRAAGAGDLLANTVKLGNKAWEENSALTKEAAERNKTFESQWQILKSTLNDVAITLGMRLLPVLKSAIDFIKPMVDRIGELADRFSKLPPSVQNAMFAVAGLAAAIGPAVYLLGSFTTSIVSLIQPAAKFLLWMTGAETVSAGLAIAFESLVGVLTGPVGLVAAIAAAGAGLLYLVSKTDAGRKALDEIWATIKTTASAVMGDVKETLRSVGEAFSGVAESIKEIWAEWGPSILASTVKAIKVVAAQVSFGIETVATVIRTGLGLMQGVIDVAMGLFKRDWSKAWDGIKTIAITAWNAVVDTVASGAKLAARIFAAFGDNRLADSLKGISTSVSEYRVQAEAASGSTSKLAESVSNAKDKGKSFETGLIDVSKAHKDGKDSANNHSDALFNFGNSTDKAAKQLDHLYESFNSSLRPANELDSEIKKLQGHFSDYDIVQIYGDKILEAAKKQREHGYVVSENVKYFEELARQMKLAKGEVFDLASALDHIKLPVDPIYIKVKADIDPELDAFIKRTGVPQLPTLPKVGIPPKLEGPPPIDTKKWDDALAHEKQALERAMQDIRQSAGHVFDELFLKRDKKADAGGLLSAFDAQFEKASDLKALKGKIIETEQDIAANEKKIVGYQKDIATFQQQNNALSQKAATNAKDRATANSQIATNQKHIADLQLKIDRERESISASRNKLTQQQNDLDAKGTLTADEKIRQLREAGVVMDANTEKLYRMAFAEQQVQESMHLSKAIEEYAAAHRNALQRTFDTIKKALNGGALSLGRSIFQDITAALFGPIKKAFDDFFKQHVLKPVTDFLSDHIGSIFKKQGGGLLDQIPGIGKGKAAAPESIPGAGAGAASAAGGGLAGGIGAATGVISTVSGVISAVGTLRLEGTMNAVEYNTRASRIHLDVMLNQLFWPWDGLFHYIAQQQGEHTNQLDAIYNVLNTRLSGAASSATRLQAATAVPQTAAVTLQAAEAAEIPSMALGGVLKDTGLVYAHKGEAVMPLEDIRKKLEERMVKGGISFGRLFERMLEQLRSLSTGSAEAQQESQQAASDASQRMAQAISKVFKNPKTVLPLEDLRKTLEERAAKGGIFGRLAEKTLGQLRSLTGETAEQLQQFQQAAESAREKAMQSLSKVFSSPTPMQPQFAFAGSTPIQSEKSIVHEHGDIIISMPVTTSQDPVDFARKVIMTIKGAYKTDRYGLRTDTAKVANQSRGLSSSFTYQE